MHPLKAYEIMLSQDCLQCSFESKDTLSPKELSAVRAYASEHQLTLRGANAFPQFVSYHPATHPWPVSDQRDIRLLCAALEAALEVSKRLKSADRFGLGSGKGPPMTAPYRCWPGQERDLYGACIPCRPSSWHSIRNLP